MATPRHLENPPIAEALVDIRVAGGKLDVAGLQPLAQSLQDRYPIVEPLEMNQASFQTVAGKLFAEARKLGVEAYFVRSQSRDRLVQLRPLQLTVNKLPPYTSGEELISESFRIWDLYLKAVKPDAVVRVAMRYINRLELPFREGDSFDRFLTASPEVPSAMSQDVSEFLTRVVVQYRESQITAIVAQRLIGNVTGSEKPVPFFLDIDVFREGQVGLTEHDLRPIFDEMRRIKNEVFFSLLMDEAVNLYV